MKKSKSERSSQNRLVTQSDSMDSFVKSSQMSRNKYAGRAPVIPAQAKELDAYMTNDGEKAADFARSLAKGLDKVAFPVK